MLKIKKAVSILLSFTMVLSFGTAAFAASYTDTQDHWAEDAIMRWSDYGVVEGDNGSFSPDGVMTRAEMATVMKNLLNLKETADISAYTDVSSGD